MSKENGSLTASKVAPSLSILSESFDGASQEKDDSSESEASSLAEEKPWSPADYPDPTLEENMGAGIFYKWEHLEYQTFEDTAVAEVIWTVIIKVQPQNTRNLIEYFKRGVFAMKRYDKQFKEEAVRLSQEIGVRRAAEQLGLSYHTLSSWRRSKKEHGEEAFVGSGRPYLSDHGMSTRELELQRKVNELRIANEILKDALGFFARDRKR